MDFDKPESTQLSPVLSSSLALLSMTGLMSLTV